MRPVSHLSGGPSLDSLFHITWFQHATGPALSLLCKQRFRFCSQSGALGVAQDPYAVLQPDLCYEGRDDRPGRILAQGRDLWPDKDRIDLIISGSAIAPGGRPCTQMQLEVRFEERRARALVQGDRVVYRRGGGLCFTRPKPFVQIPVDAFHAYGGIDPHHVPERLEDTPMVMGVPVPELFPGAYPRNPSGVGYWIDAHTVVDGLLLPNIECPEQLLDPENIIRRDPCAWPLAPRPITWGFCGLTSYPRMIHAGRWPVSMPRPQNRAAWAELEDPRDQERLCGDPLSVGLSPELFAQGSRDLAISMRPGDLALHLSGFSPQGDLALTVPSQAPCVQIYRNGELRAHQSRRLTVQVDTERQELLVTWAAISPIAPLGRGDLDLETLQRHYQVQVNGELLPPDCWPSPRPT